MDPLVHPRRPSQTPWIPWTFLDPWDTLNTPLDPLGHLYAHLTPLDTPGVPLDPLMPITSLSTPLDTPDVHLYLLGHPWYSLDPLVHP